MKTKRNPRVDAYIAKAAEFARPILRQVRELVHEACPEVEEEIKWSFPFFVHHGILCSVAAFKAHCTLGFWHQGMKRVLGAGGDKPGAMGHFGRITRREDLPDDATLRRYIREAAKLNESGVPGRPAKKPQGELPTPKDLAAALKKHARAAKTFADFSTTHRREYVEWITEAKQEETRQKRLRTAVEWLMEGKSRHWKYQRS